MTTPPGIHCRRIYTSPRPDDGLRVLIDRLWPRGLSKAHARLDWWFREIAPSTELRRWFGHDPARWEVFRRRYRAELDGRPEAVAELLARAREAGIMTLLFAARDLEHNHARVLQDYLLAHLHGDPSRPGSKHSEGPDKADPGN